MELSWSIVVDRPVSLAVEAHIRTRRAVMATCLRLLPIVAGGLLLTSPLVSCAPPKASTTFLQSVDLVDSTEKMARSFAQSPAIMSRTYASPRWIISIDKIVNHTNQIIPENEKWAYIGRLRARMTQARISEQRSLVWIVPPEKWPIIAEELRSTGEPPDLRRPPTHLLTGQFSALTNTSGEGRSDAYLCTYELVDLATGEVVWQDSWEVKRSAVGKTYD